MPSWGLVSWVPGESTELCHPDDLGVAEATPPQGHAMQLIDETAEYCRLRYAGGDIRVKPDAFRPLPESPYQYGDAVATRQPRSPVRGDVCRILWHHRDSDFDYYLAVDGKPLKSRYRADELRTVAGQIGD